MNCGFPGTDQTDTSEHPGLLPDRQRGDPEGLSGKGGAGHYRECESREGINICRDVPAPVGQERTARAHRSIPADVVLTSGQGDCESVTDLETTKPECHEKVREGFESKFCNEKFMEEGAGIYIPDWIGENLLSLWWTTSKRSGSHSKFATIM